MKRKKITREEIPSMEEKDRMKYEIAEELGLLDQVLEEGWKSLSSKETGRIGGLMTRRRRKSAKKKSGTISSSLWKTRKKK